MIYQERTLEAAQLRIAKLTHALKYWLPDELKSSDKDYGMWIMHSALLGKTIDVCNECGEEYVQCDEGGLCQICNGLRHE